MIRIQVCFESLCNCPVEVRDLQGQQLLRGVGLVQTTCSTLMGGILWLWTVHGSSLV